MTRWIVFVVVSVPLVAVSWKSLHDPTSHGFYRFFAWESILGLILMNVGYWFDNPVSWHQLIAWFLLLVSLIPLALGVHALRTRGQPTTRRRADASLLAFEKTTALVTGGIYAYIRHPLYGSLGLLAWGVFFKAPSWIGALLAATASLFLVATARADEAECIQFFGISYRDYRQKTKMFVPFVF